VSRHEVDDLTIWFGTADAPAPTGEGLEPAPEITVGISPSMDDVDVIVRYRRPGGPWQRLMLQPAAPSAEAQYFTGRFSPQPAASQVEYEIHVRRGGPRPRA